MCSRHAEVCLNVVLSVEETRMVIHCIKQNYRFKCKKSLPWVRNLVPPQYFGVSKFFISPKLSQVPGVQVLLLKVMGTQACINEVKNLYLTGGHT